jgi:hypothetical protein
VNDTDARLWHPWLRINRVLRVMQHTRWSAEARSQVRLEDAVVAAGVRERTGSSNSLCQNCARTIGHYRIPTGTIVERTSGQGPEIVANGGR